MNNQILSGIRVWELGQLIAGQFAAKTLADFGAEVIKVETPGDGDPLRKWRLLHNAAILYSCDYYNHNTKLCVGNSDALSAMPPSAHWLGEGLSCP
jgi:formyl-CoA transferase